MKKIFPAVLIISALIVSCANTDVNKKAEQKTVQPGIEKKLYPTRWKYT